MNQTVKIMTPGPTQVRENVRMARSFVTTNPDLDLTFYEEYKTICDRLSALLHTDNVSYILSGEGILGLEAACASLTEPGDRVLVLDNGIFGKGFADFVKLYGGEPVLYTVSDKKAIDVDALKQYLQENHDFKYATVVHCDTPTGVLNPIEQICPLLKQYGILTVVDAVASMFGVEIDVDAGQVDILCGGSQKALSAPPGLTMLTVSSDAIQAMEERKIPIASFYANILTFKNYYKDKWFPYTMPISDIYGLGAALDNVLADQNIYVRHAQIAEAVRTAVVEAGLKLYLDNDYCSTVTVIEVPKDVNSAQFLQHMTDEYGIMIAGCFDYLAGKVFRLGHMGEGANVDDVVAMLDAMDQTFADLGYLLKCSMKDVFERAIKQV
ncbi:MAG: alanine--glyoxylate aminotransferase family protein [Peptococcaceae bacterium]|jgi:aspartate aminotransferase-like enzyme|nr:alanine--glyoxylate aminotransferase family protein [Peptococcaceae bacterium]MBQ2432034.1 alanine--glyoxylate aminotransferase family protein [Peptococcaceae bacterium]MBQ5615927.1 alanine--glyoxylate aminotransferase family protein [Peptococcaceae bacterium]